MADIAIDVKLDKGGRAPFVAIDGLPVSLNSKGHGVVEVSGACGDGSIHVMVFSWQGPAGATMEVAIKCHEASLGKVGPLAISEATEPFGGSMITFAI